jgi:hypothetical protein
MLGQEGVAVVEDPSTGTLLPTKSSLPDQFLPFFFSFPLNPNNPQYLMVFIYISV